MARKDSKSGQKRKRGTKRHRVAPETLLRLRAQAYDGSAQLRAGLTSSVALPEAEQCDDPEGRRLAQAAGESLRYSALSVLALAERRITELELVQLERLVEREPEHKTVRESLGFLGSFWGLIVRATLNPDLERHVGRRLQQASHLQRRYGIGLESNNRILSKAPYRALVRALRRGYGAPAFWAQRLEAMAAGEL